MFEDFSRCDFVFWKKILVVILHWKFFLILTLCQKFFLSVIFQMTSSVVDEDDGVSIVALILPICASLVGWGAKTFEFILRY